MFQLECWLKRVPTSMLVVIDYKKSKEFTLVLRDEGGNSGISRDVWG